MSSQLSIRVFSSAWVNSTPDFCAGVGAHSNEGAVQIPILSALVSHARADDSIRQVLVDCGIPNRPRPGGRPAPLKWQAPRSTLNCVGIGPEQIDLLVLTHLHRDHCATVADFPDSTVVVQRAELDGWLGTLDAPAAALPQGSSSWLRRPIEPAAIIALAGRKENLRTLEGPADLGDGVSVACSDGHSFGSQWLLLDGGPGQRYVIAGDTVMWYSNLSEMWPPGAGQGRSIQLISDFVEILEYVDGDLDHVVPGHDPTIFERFPTIELGQSSCVELCVAEWDQSWRPA